MALEKLYRALYSQYWNPHLTKELVEIVPQYGFLEKVLQY